MNREMNEIKEMILEPALWFLLFLMGWFSFVGASFAVWLFK